MLKNQPSRDGESGDEQSPVDSQDTKKLSGTKKVAGQQQTKNTQFTSSEADNCQGLILKMRLIKAIIALTLEMVKFGFFVQTNLPPTSKLRIINGCQIEEVDTQELI